MISIGLRAEPEGLHWTVLSNDSGIVLPVEFDFIAAPKIGDESSSLGFFRERILSIIKRLSPSIGMVRTPESNRQKKYITSDDARLRIEGVILEALHASGIKVISGPMKTIGRMLDTKKPIEYLKAENLGGIIYPNKDTNCRESFLAAFAAINNGE